jgi:hypothetical protein
VFSALDEAASLDMLSRDLSTGAGIYKVSVPTRASATNAQARARRMPIIRWSAQLDGAVHSSEADGWLYVTLAA